MTFLDTGSYGLRILASALTLSLPAQTDASGNPIGECAPFVAAFTCGAGCHRGRLLPRDFRMLLFAWIKFWDAVNRSLVVAKDDWLVTYGNT
jgi:hypothetical protein